MKIHLRIPDYIATIIVPTFSLDYPETDKSSNENNRDKKKYAPKQQTQSGNNGPAKKQQKQSQRKELVIPNSTKDAMPVNTPHGWQKLTPEQYWDAVLSLHATAGNNSNDKSADGSSSNAANTACKQPLCEGTVGLFDHMGLTRDQINFMFAKSMNDKENNGGSDKNDTDTDVLSPKAQKALTSSDITSPNGSKWGTLLQRLVQRTNDWSYRMQHHSKKEQQSSSINFWTPVHMVASHLSQSALLARMTPWKNAGQFKEATYNNCCQSNNVAIVGWDAISYSRDYRRHALRQILNTLGQPSSPTMLASNQKKCLLLSVSDLQSMLDVAREGISIIGTDMVREWSCDGKALCLDMNRGDEKNKSDDKIGSGGKMDLREKQYARDSQPILPGCQCLACRPRRKGTSRNYHNDHGGNGNSSNDDQMKKEVPSFTRAYIHHLLEAKEMLAETLLFVHNLHQMLLLFRKLSEAALLDENGSGGGAVDGNENGKLEAFCQRIEEQLQISGFSFESGKSEPRKDTN